MKPGNEIYTPEELEIVRQIENGDYCSLPPEEFESEKERLEYIAKNTLRRQNAERLIQLMKSMKPNEEAEMLTLEDINRMVHEIRKELNN